MPDALQVFQKDVLLGIKLPGRGQMLEYASRADAEMRAFRCDAVWRRFVQFDHSAFVVMPVATGLLDTDPLTGQCSGDKNGLAVQTADTAPVVGEAVDRQIEFAFCFFSAPCHNASPLQNAIFADLSPSMGI